MKKRFNRFLVGLITLTMIVSSTGLAFAGETSDGKQKADSLTKNGVSVVPQAGVKVPEAFAQGLKNANINDKLSAKKATPGNNFTVTEIKKGTDAELEAAAENLDEINYNINDDVLDSTEFCGYSQKVTLKKGTVIMTGLVLGDSEDYYAGANFGLYYDAYMNDAVDSSGYDEEDAYNDDPADLYGQRFTSAAFSVPKDGEYYLGVYSYVPSAEYAQNYSFLVATMSISGKDRTVYSGTRIAVGQKNVQTNTFTFKATKTGYIKLTTTDVKPKFRLYNASNVARSKQSVSCSSIVYGVKKGNTYKIKVTAPENAAGAYTMLLTNYVVTESSGSTKAKAKTIYRGSAKAKKGSIIAGYNTPDWYKFNLTSKKAVNIKMTGATNETLKISVYKGSKLIKTSSFNRTTESVTIKSVGKWTKGTYYIKVYRGNSTSSGHYKVYWYYR